MVVGLRTRVGAELGSAVLGRGIAVWITPSWSEACAFTVLQIPVLSSVTVPQSNKCIRIHEHCQRYYVKRAAFADNPKPLADGAQLTTLIAAW